MQRSTPDRASITPVEMASGSSVLPCLHFEALRERRLRSSPTKQHFATWSRGFLRIVAPMLRDMARWKGIPPCSASTSRRDYGHSVPIARRRRCFVIMAPLALEEITRSMLRAAMVVLLLNTPLKSAAHYVPEEQKPTISSANNVRRRVSLSYASSGSAAFG